MAKAIVSAAYAVTLPPVLMFFLYSMWAIAKNMRDASVGRAMPVSVGQIVITALPAGIILSLWTAGVVGLAMLARRGRRWLLWATVPLVLLSVALIAVITPFVVYFMNYKPIP